MNPTIEEIVVHGKTFKRCKYKHEIAHDMFGCTVLDKVGWTTKNHSHLIEEDKFDKVIVREEYDNYEVYEDEF